MSEKIETTGQLREFLCDVLQDVRHGEIETETAARLTRLAAQVNESFYAEVKVIRAKQDLGQKIDTFGSLHVNVGDEEEK
jgi:hypothetical protein